MNRLSVRLVAAALVATTCGSPLSTLAGHVSLKPEKAVSVKAGAEKPVSSFARKFDLSKIEKGQRVDMAILKLTFNADTQLGEGVEILVYVAGESWQESVLARQSPIRTIDTLLTASHAASGDEMDAEFHVTELVQMWYDGKVANNGFALSVHGNTDRKFELANQPGEWGASLEVFFSKAE